MMNAEPIQTSPPSPPAAAVPPAPASTPTPGDAGHEAALAATVRAELDRVLEAGNGTAITVPAATSAATDDEWALVHQGRLTEADLLRIYANAAGLKPLDEEQYGKPEPFLEAAFDFLCHWNCLPLTWDQSGILLAVAAPYRLGELAWQWQVFFGRHASFVLGRRSWIERQLTELYEKNLDAAETSLTAGDDDSEQALRDLAREAPIVRLVNDMFSRAVEMGASDIHVEPSEGDLAVRYRIDGVLQTVLTPPKSHYAAISSRLKLLAGMNIAERRLPQDGRIDLQIGRNAIDVRVSTVPSMHGESIVLRLLQKDVSIFDLGNLGMDATLRGPFEETVQMPHGMVLVVGPTGSGKTTTLYCVMKLLNHESSKIITMEDPVEYQMPGLTQIQVKTQIGLTFANGLRSIVRQDPDIILVGEIRDRETAEIAIQAALTGHLVLSTLHTNDAPGAISRLLDMGVEGFLISSALLGVLSQRLVRRICPDCHGTGRATPADAPAVTATDTPSATPDAPTNAKPVTAHRCRTCAGSGFRGRVGIYEWMHVNDELRRAINDRKDATELATIARRHGMRPLREDGELKVQAGITTAAEVARVCQLDSAV